jgi:hydrogenase expression/formation protein HypC
MCLGIPGQLVEVLDVAEQRAIADVDGVKREINIGLVLGEAGGIKVGDWVLIHVGFALSKIDEEEAARTLAFIKELGSVYDDELAQFSESQPWADGPEDIADDIPAANGDGASEAEPAPAAVRP